MAAHDCKRLQKTAKDYIRQMAKDRLQKTDCKRQTENDYKRLQKDYKKAMKSLKAFNRLVHILIIIHNLWLTLYFCKVNQTCAKSSVLIGRFAKANICSVNCLALWRFM